MQLKATLIELGINPTNNTQGFLTLQVDRENQPTQRPVRIPVADVESIRALAQYLYQDVVISIAPAVQVTTDFSRSDDDLPLMASELALAITGRDIQPGAAALAQIVARLAYRIENAFAVARLLDDKLVDVIKDAAATHELADIAAGNACTAHDALNTLRETVSKLETVVEDAVDDVRDVQDTLLDRHADRFARDLHVGATSDAGAVITDGFESLPGAFGTPIADPAKLGAAFAGDVPGLAPEIAESRDDTLRRRVPRAFAPEPGIDTQVTPTWIEPALADIADAEYGPAGTALRALLEPIVRADETTPDKLTIGATGIRNDVWLIYRPKRALGGLDVISLRDGVCALVRAVFADAGETMRLFQIHAYAAAGAASETVAIANEHLSPPPNAVPLPVDNDYADLWLTNSEDMARAIGRRFSPQAALDAHRARLAELVALIEADPASREDMRRDTYRGMPDDQVVADLRRNHAHYSSWSDATVIGHADWPPMDAVITYLGGKYDPPLVVSTPDDGAHEVHYKMMARIWATWSGREVRLVGPGEPLVFDAIETPEATLRAQTVQALRDGAIDPRTWVDPQASTPWAGGALAENGSEAMTEPADEVAAEHVDRRRRDAQTLVRGHDGPSVSVPAGTVLTDMDAQTAAALDESAGDSPPEVPDPDIEPDYWSDEATAAAGMMTPASSPKSRKKARRRR